MFRIANLNLAGFNGTEIKLLSGRSLHQRKAPTVCSPNGVNQRPINCRKPMHPGHSYQCKDQTHDTARQNSVSSSQIERRTPPINIFMHRTAPESGAVCHRRSQNLGFVGFLCVAAHGSAKDTWHQHTRGGQIAQSTQFTSCLFNRIGTPLALEISVEVNVLIWVVVLQCPGRLRWAKTNHIPKLVIATMRQIPHHWPWNVVQRCTAFARKHVSNRQLVSGVQTRFNSKNARSNFQGHFLIMQNCFLPLSKNYFTLHLGVSLVSQLVGSCLAEHGTENWRGICLFHPFPWCTFLLCRFTWWINGDVLTGPNLYRALLHSCKPISLNIWKQTCKQNQLGTFPLSLPSQLSQCSTTPLLRSRTLRSGFRIYEHNRRSNQHGYEGWRKKCSKSNWMTRMTPQALSVNKQVYKARKWKGIKFRNRWLAQRRSAQHESVLPSGKMNWEERQPSWPTYLKCKYNILSRYFELSCLKPITLDSTVKKSIVDAVGNWFGL